jgi:4-diphosphocytidyl-2-C-methyl-D-erythritol kinase
VIDAVLAGLNDQPGCRVAAMSGSGATCFGLFETAAAAKAAASAIGAAQPGWWAVASHLTR